MERRQFPSRRYRPPLRGFSVSIIGFSGKRMSSKVLFTSTCRCFSTLKFSSICEDDRYESGLVQENKHAQSKFDWRSTTCLTWMRKICISVSAILRPRHWRGPKPKPRLLKYCVSVLSQRDGWYCSGRKNTLGSRPIAYRPNCTRVCTEKNSKNRVEPRHKRYRNRGKIFELTPAGMW